MPYDQGEMISNFQDHTASNLDLRFKKTQTCTTSNFNILSEDFYLDCKSLSRKMFKMLFREIEEHCGRI